MSGPALPHDSGKREAREACRIVLHRTMAEDALLRRVRSAFREMPGMRLTVNQAMRLWDLDRPTCCALLDSLVASHFLQQDMHGRYGCAHAGY
jgi:hypothetical protein